MSDRSGDETPHPADTTGWVVWWVCLALGAWGALGALAWVVA